MEIDNSEGRPVSGLGRSSGVAAASQSGRSTNPAGPSLAADRVQLSNLSEHLAAALGDSSAHLKRLSSLAAAAVNGGYLVDARVVSDSIIRHSLQFGGANYL